MVGQSDWLEGEGKFADVILAACTSFERWDVAVMQHKCIEPLGDSQSDFQIFLAPAERPGLGNVLAEGSSELDRCERLFEATDSCLIEVERWGGGAASAKESVAR